MPSLTPPRLTRVHFKFIAEALRDAQKRCPPRDCADQRVHDTVAETVADALAGTNPRFDRQKFLDACAVETA